MSSDNEKGPNPGLAHDEILEDAIPKLDERTLEVLQAEEDAHLGVKRAEAAEKVYGRYSKWFLFVGCVFAFRLRLLLLAFGPCQQDLLCIISSCQNRLGVLYLLPRRQHHLQLSTLRHLVVWQA